MRVYNLSNNPYKTNTENSQIAPWVATGFWPSKWIQCQGSGDKPFVSAYKKCFELEKDYTIRVHVSADERYELFVDGELIGRGSERGDKYNWYFETYDLELEKGSHVIVARVWTLMSLKPAAQISVSPGFIFSPQEEPFIELLGTGVSKWEAKILDGYEFVPFDYDMPQWAATGAKLKIDGRLFQWGFQLGRGNGWLPVKVGEPGFCGTCNYILDNSQVLKSAKLLEQIETETKVGVVRFVGDINSLEDIEKVIICKSSDLPLEHEQWQKLIDGQTLIINPHTTKRIIIDLGDYYCMYPKIEMSGGKDSLLRLYWGEALYEKDEKLNYIKSNRDIVFDRYFRGIGDVFETDGGEKRAFDTLWWHAGRYLELIVKTKEEPLVLNSLKFYETRYPLELESSFDCDDDSLQNIKSRLFRTLQMCAHETYMDCPYYEQLMYVGDTRIQSLVTYVSTLDTLLPEKAINMFQYSSFNHTGLIKCAYPDSTGKIIPSFCLWWIGMVYDFALWRGNKTFIRSLMPVVRGTIERYLYDTDENGLLINPEGWNFYDWANNDENILYEDNEHWSFGVPAFNHSNESSIFNWHMVLSLKYLSRLEEYLGETEMSIRSERIAASLSAKIIDKFWDKNRGIFSDDLNYSSYSEHSQILSVLSGTLDTKYLNCIKQAFESGVKLIETSIYFSHYYVEALRMLECEEIISQKLSIWNNLSTEGLMTTPEVFSSDTRSDCHAWGAHPFYHMFATLLGVRPGSMAFETVEIRPSLLHLNHLKGSLVHSMGMIDVELTRLDKDIRANIYLPEGLKGCLKYCDRQWELRTGYNEILIHLPL